ncbi:hypothetical protein [Pseudoduganella violaceinigra]|uniref:hypothetical protein n=1 Tax=Pseudoduganella violaceinigra TaxID=246602 RepID=UPI000421FB61|nr:hypothetical protein [Pseudoduganella violaceinigra]
MKTNSTLLRSLLLAAGLFGLGASAYAQTGHDVQRNVNQQERIEQGLKSGQLNTREAAKLEREEAHVDQMQARALKDGHVSAQEQQRIDAAQNQVSHDIYREKHDADVGNPNSASSKRMQADVQRNVNQQKRIEQGVRSGELTNREAGRLERQEGHIAKREANAGADGHVGAHEQGRIQRAENRESRRIHHAKNNDAVRG